jgi:hypothetical protein
MKLQIQPLVALCDTKLDIDLSGLPPSGKVKISASMRLPWAKDVPYESSAWFTANAVGNLDLSKQKPDSGSYDFIDSMGLIVSMKSQDPKAMEKIIRNISVDENIYIDIQTECGQNQESATVERRFKKPGIRSQRITDEFVGELFYTDPPQNKTIVWLAGSGGGLGVNSLVCAPLASHGFNVLS